MAYFDLVRGWVGLKDHELIVFSGPFDPTPERVAQIHGLLHSVGLEYQSGHSMGSDFELAAIRFDQFIVGRVKTPAGSVVWTRESPAMWRRTMFVMVSSGSVSVTGSSATYSSNDGDILIIFPGSTPATIQVDEPSEFLTFSFEEAVAEQRLTPDNVAELDSDSCIFQSTHAYLKALVESHSTSRLDDSASMKAMTRAMAQALTTAAMKPESERDVFTQARSLITAKSGDVTLGPSQIAERLGVSRRTLFRAFAEQQTTVANEIHIARTNRALEMLRENPQILTKDLAEGSGFASESSLRRALKARFGSTLTQLRGSIREQIAA